MNKKSYIQPLAEATDMMLENYMITDSLIGNQENTGDPDDDDEWTEEQNARERMEYEESHGIGFGNLW